MPADRIAELEAFLAVAQAGSLSAAARRLGLTPSSVSRIVARTEARLGVRLLLRTTRRLQLTAEGEVYLRAAGRILADLDETEGGIADQAAPRGLLRVSAALAYGRMVVVPLLGEFLRRYPEIKLDIELSDRIVDVAGGRADVAIRFGPLPDSGLLARKLDETGRTVVAAPDYLRRAGTPLRPADLQSHSCLDFSFRRVQAGWPFREDGQDRLLGIKGSLVANNGDTLVQLARQGMGIARVGAFAVAADIAAGRLVPLLEAFNPGDTEAIHAVFVGGTILPARVRVFVDFLAGQVRPGSAS